MGCVSSGRGKRPDGWGIESMHYIGMAAMRLPAYAGLIFFSSSCPSCSRFLISLPIMD